VIEKWLIKRVLAGLGDPPLGIKVWDGEIVAPRSGGQIEFAFAVRDRRTLWQLLYDPWFHFGEAYCSHRLEVIGDFCDALRSIYRHRAMVARSGSRALRWLRVTRRNTVSRSRDNVWHHYDIGNDFYKLWLDEQLVYTCAYFPDQSMSLEDAQTAKMDHICRKLELRPGQRVLEAGCGWGAFALHMARHYDVRVKAFNVSREQIAHARLAAAQQGLADRVEYVEADWRTMNEPCDVFVSVGMLEHVGLRNYQTLGEVIDRCLKPDGRGLLHTIGQNQSSPVNSWIQRRIFPGGYPPTLGEMMDILEPQRFSVLDAENLRLHYAETLRHWLERFERKVEAVREMFDDQFVRMWRLYLCGSLAAFESGDLQLFQVLFNRGTSNNVPRTRAALYAAIEEPTERLRRVPR
jgi:cyclopropane-fatty-acyl-phospholipid synthase